MALKKNNLFRFYPGSIWFKRLKHLLLIYGIGLNCFLGTIQNKVIENIEHKTDEIESSNLLLRQNQFPSLKYIRIEEGSKKEKIFKKIRAFLENAFEIEVITIKRINEIADISNNVKNESQKITNHIKNIKESLSVVLKVLKVTSNIVWIPIVWSMIWLFFDVRLGDARRFVYLCLILSVPFNVMVFNFFSNYLMYWINF